MLNQLPHYLREIPVLYTRKFKNSSKSFLLGHWFYSLDEFSYLENDP
jgi:hypothetical protein